VDNIGKFHAKVGQDKLETIKKAAIDIGYFDLSDEYPSQISDFPSTITSVKINGKRKHILDRQGAPQKLKEFESLIDSLYKDVRWIPFPDENK